MSTKDRTTRELFLMLEDLYVEFSAPAIYTDRRERQKTLDAIKECQAILRERHKKPTLQLTFAKT